MSAYIDHQDPLRHHVAGYLADFGVPEESPVCYEALMRYLAKGDVTFGFHLPQERGTRNVLFTYVKRELLNQAQKHAIVAQYRDIPQVATADIIWPAAYHFDYDTQELVGKLLSISLVRHLKIQQRSGCPQEVTLRTNTLPEVQLLLNLFPDICYLAVEFGPLVPGTNLRYVTKLYRLADHARASVLN